MKHESIRKKGFGGSGKPFQNLVYIETNDNNQAPGGCPAMKGNLIPLAILVLCLILVSPALAQDKKPVPERRGSYTGR
ncbi:MAG: hypothetical protein A4E35_00044 [Methanoregula sp. PtaU1.Bin051]|nr:MAG: hypothetical protein A4E35_00044 [Methanoregula sp. PtaU1.Bin051]